ncbi:MAG: N-acetylmuramoyl-L-alanine amidase [Candidatus Marinimicrobia bacterium]|nr:N-acetylmuramoyl-L-alanine amidase [Candidatus Neomarinimicrobiota bacterium]
MEIKNHRLKGKNIKYQESPNHSGKLKNGVPDTIVIHYTSGGSVEGAISTLCNPIIKASAHLVIGRDKSITQLVNFDTIAWHAGRSSYKGRNSFNNFSIGIEIDNAGKLEKSEAGYVAWFGRNYQSKDVIKAVHRNQSESTYWHKYTEDQIELVFEICEELIKTYPIELIVGHEEIAPSRKIDPGPAFPLDKLRTRLLSHNRAEDGSDEKIVFTQKMGVVTANRLNIRSDPWLGAKTVAPPLAGGTELKILDETNGWYHVDIVHKGWVSKKYVSS